MEAKIIVVLFSQGTTESLCEAWEKYKPMLRKYPNCCFDDLIQIHVLTDGLQNNQIYC